MTKVNFLEFIKLCCNTIFPNYKYYNLWHIKVLADRLEAAMHGKITRLIINMPPRSMKSTCVSIAWPAWILGKNPKSKIIVASYSQILSERLSLDSRYIVQSDWYKELFPDVMLSSDQNTKSKFQTTAHGCRFATSVVGSLTGEGGDFLIVDDPISAMQANSKTYRDKVSLWFDQTFMTRLNDHCRGTVVVVMHRLHVDDLSSHLLSKICGKWQHLSLPMIAEKKTKFFSVSEPWIMKFKKRKRNILYSRKEGEILYRRKSKKYIDRLKSDLGSYAFAAQYQQNPLCLSSGIIKEKWFGRYKSFTFQESMHITQSWDTANSINKRSDFSVCSTWAYSNNYFYLLEVIREKLEYPALKELVIKLGKKWYPNAVLIEGSASGLQLIQELKLNTNFPIIKTDSVIDKISRFRLIASIIESGRVFIPLSALWLSEFEEEIFSFPNCRHDDQVDSMTQYLRWIYNKVNDDLCIREL